MNRAHLDRVKVSTKELQARPSSLAKADGFEIRIC